MNKSEQEKIFKKEYTKLYKKIPSFWRLTKPKLYAIVIIDVLLLGGAFVEALYLPSVVKKTPVTIPWHSEGLEQITVEVPILVLILLLATFLILILEFIWILVGMKKNKAALNKAYELSKTAAL